jgi:LysM repeat protein
MFPWKIQRIFKLPVADYSRLRESLPAPPEGMAWVQNEETKEWRLVKAVPKEPELIVEEKTTVAVPVTPDAKPSVVYDQLPPRCGVVDRLPQFSEKSNKEEDWEFLSDRISASSNQTPSVITTTSGSVRSLTSMEGGGNSLSSHNTTLSLPFKIQRTASSSTIDSSDGALGPSGKGVLGVDYLEHVIMPTDTLQGICIAYKISSTRLRQANHFSGNSLLLAPKKLVIPLSKKALRSGFIRVQDTDAKEYKLHAILAEFPDLSMTEAKA